MASRAAAGVLLLVLLQAVDVQASANLIAPVLVKGAVKGAKAAAAGFAAGALSGLPVTTFDQMHVPANFSAGYCEGNGFCFPKYRAARVEHVELTCGDGAYLNSTRIGAACIRQTYSRSTTCFKSMACPAGANFSQSDELCLPTEVRNAMIGVLAVFKVKATLPLMILPALKLSILKAVWSPIVLPKALLLSMANMKLAQDTNATITGPQLLLPDLDLGGDDFNITLTHPANALTAAFHELAAVGDSVKAALINGTCNPLELVAKAVLNTNVTEVMGAVPEINAWVEDKLSGVLHVANITAELDAAFPRCVYRCCRPDTRRDTSVALPTPVCANGTNLHPLLGLCIGGELGYAPCPYGFDRCILPNGQPLCLAERTVWGMNACKLAGVVMHSLPKWQCPTNSTAAYGAYGEGNGTTIDALLEQHKHMFDKDVAVEVNVTGIESLQLK